MRILWGNYEDILPAQRIDEIKINLIKVEAIEGDLAEEIMNILSNNLIEESNRCITFYRDCVVAGENVFDICLSCGDVLKDGKHFLLSKKGENRLLEIKQQIL